MPCTYSHTISKLENRKKQKKKKMYYFPTSTTISSSKKKGNYINKKSSSSLGITSSSRNNNSENKIIKTKGSVMRLSTDPQSVAARERRHRISDRFKTLQSLVPGGSKMDTVSMLEEAIQYVKFLKAQIWLHQNMIMINGNHHDHHDHDRSMFLTPPDHDLSVANNMDVFHDFTPQELVPTMTSLSMPSDRETYDSCFQNYETTSFGHCNAYVKY